MLPAGFNWDKIKGKEGDNKNVSLTPVESSVVIALILNLKLISENGGLPQMLEDKDNFDAVVDGILQKLLI